MKTLKKAILTLILILSLSFVLFSDIEKEIERMIYIGKASYYGEKFHGNKTASGEVYDMNNLTAASPLVGNKPIFPFGTKILVINKENGKSVIVKINDTGGFRKFGRTLDLSKGAMQALDGIQKGVIDIEYEILNEEELKREVDYKYLTEKENDSDLENKL